VRQQGSPQTVMSNFAKPLLAQAPFTMIVRNGKPDGTGRVSSAIVLLNGVQVFGTQDFNQQAVRLEKEINLADANRVQVEVRSQPGSELSIQIGGQVKLDSTITKRQFDVGSDGGSLDLPGVARLDVPAGGVSGQVEVSAVDS